MRQRWLLLSTLFLVPGAVRAQVGHDPARSPYHDLRARQALSVITGYGWGSGGSLGVGPAKGQIFSVRYDRQVMPPLDILLGLSVARLQRFLINPNLATATRRTGPEGQDIAMMEAGASVVLTGRKTWRGLVPYFGGTIGVAFPAGLEANLESYFEFGTKAVVAPHLGIKWYPTQAIAVKLEARNYFWRLHYPEVFFVSPEGTPEIPPVIDPLVTPSSTEWTHVPAVLFSVGYTFTY